MVQASSYDILIVGAGNAGLCAAMTTLERNARVGVLEKAPREQRGGNSTLASHMLFAYNSVEDLVPLMKEVSKEALKAITERLPARKEADLWDEIMRVTTEGQSDQDPATSPRERVLQDSTVAPEQGP
jgi:tricarballylate dehydrogenase